MTNLSGYPPPILVIVSLIGTVLPVVLGGFEFISVINLIINYD